MNSDREHSKLWLEQKEDVESAGEDWDEFRAESLSRRSVQVLRMAAAELDLDTDGTKREIAEDLADEGCFFGPIGDDTVYQERDGEAKILVRKGGVYGYQTFKRRSEVKVKRDE